MKKFIAASMLPIGAMLAFAAPALAAPGQSGGASATINQLQAQGSVQISRVGNAPLDECTVVGVRNLPVVNQPIIINDDDDFNVFNVPRKPRFAVSLDCSN